MSPTVIATFAYVILCILIVWPDKNKKIDIRYRFILLCILLIPIVLSIYSINCMIKGRCYTWSYIQATAICVWVALVLVARFIK